MKLTFFTTGGTIDKVYFDDNSSFEVGDPQVGKLLGQTGVAFDFDVVSLMRKDSLDLTDADRNLIARSIVDDPGDRFVVTHGTDTMVKTAEVLLALPEIVVGKTVVLTGSLQPIRFIVSDGVFNIAYAVGVAQHLPPGVYIAMHGKVFDPARTQKNLELQQFEEQ